MFFRNSGSLYLALVVCTSANAVQSASAAQAVAKSTTVRATSQVPIKKHAKKIAAHYRYKTYFVPPPPAYMPSILPELAQRYGSGQSPDAQLAKKPENPYKKYVHTPDGEAPEPVQVRKGVVTWTPHS